MLSEAAIKAARPRLRAFKVWDGGGLHLLVAPNGRRSWLLRSRTGGRERLLTLGAWPELSLGAARDRRDAVMAGAGLTGATLESVARSWIAVHRGDWSEAHAADVAGALERHVFPVLGSKPIAGIAPGELIEILDPLAGRPLGRRLRQQLAGIFGYARVQRLVADNTAAGLGCALSGGVRPPRAQPALTSIEECRALLAACERIEARPATRLASRLLALTAVRLDAVRGARWEEFDLEAKLWTVPAARMKLARAKKGEARFDHVVPLSAAAVEVLRAADEQFAENAKNSSALVFPGRNPLTPIGEGSIGALIGRTQFAGRHVPHGWRASFSTIMNEDLGEAWSRTIDRALAHTPKDKVEAAYNRAQQLDRRRAVMERWGDLLTAAG